MKEPNEKLVAEELRRLVLAGEYAVNADGNILKRNGKEWALAG